MDKPFKSVAEQIAILESRGLECDNDTRLVLEREGYYPVVNGYKDLFLDQRDGSGQEVFVRRYEKAIWVASPAAQLLSASSGCHNGL